MYISRYLILLAFVFGLGCSAASASQPSLFAGLFTLFAAFLAACNNGSKFSVTPGDGDPVTDTTDVTAPTDLTDPTDVTEPTDPKFGPGYGLLRTIKTSASFAGMPPVVGADFNGDGVADVAVLKGDATAVYVVFGGGDADVSVESLGAQGFRIDGDFGVGERFAVGDINGDNKDDLVIRNSADSKIHVVFGAASAAAVSADTLGARGFNINASIGSGQGAPTIGDFNGDGKDDLAIVRAGGYGADVVFGKATTNDISASGLPQYQGFYVYDVSGLHQGGQRSDGIVSGDFNGDGKDDLVFRNPGDSVNYVIFGATDHTMVMPVSLGSDGFQVSGYTYDMDPLENEVVVADVNGDGKDDIVYPGRRDNRITVLFGKSDANDVDLNSAFGGFHIQGDIFSNSNYYDYSSSQLPATTASGGPYGTQYFYLERKYFTYRYQNANEAVLAADFNGDGKDDLVFGGKENGTSEKVYIVFGRTATSTVDTGSLGTGGVRIVGDFVKKTTEFGPKEVHPYYSSYYGKYYYRQSVYQYHRSWAHKAAGDVDGDGKLDLGIVQGNKKAIGILGNALTGTSLNFAGASTDTVVPTGTIAHDVAVADLTGDGKDDIVLRNYSTQIFVFGQLPEEP